MLLKLGLLMAGYLCGVLTCNILYRESFKKYALTLHKEYKEAIEKIKKEKEKEKEPEQ